MERRRLGRTGHLSTVVAFGAAGIGRQPQEVADRAHGSTLASGSHLRQGFMRVVP